MSISLVRTIILYLAIVFSLRLMGRRQLGEMKPSELVVTILVSNIATLSIEDSNIPFLGSLIPILTIVCLEVFASTLALKSRTVRKIISGNPRVIIESGQIVQQELKNLRLTIDDLLELLRDQSIFDLKDVELGIMETSGSLSVYQTYSARPATPEMLGMPNKESPPPFVVVSDRQIVPDSLGRLGLSEAWLTSTIAKHGHSITQVFLMTCNSLGEYEITVKDSDS